MYEDYHARLGWYSIDSTYCRVNFRFSLGEIYSSIKSWDSECKLFSFAKVFWLSYNIYRE